MDKIKVLFLPVDPAQFQAAQLDEAVSRISQKVRAHEPCDSVELVACWAVNAKDLYQALMGMTPCIVHFCRLGSDAKELVILDEKRRQMSLSPEALMHLFGSLSCRVCVLVMEAPCSSGQARTLDEITDCRIEANRPLSDDAATLFAGTFYRALGLGRSVREAFDLGRAALLDDGVPRDDMPLLFSLGGAEAWSLIPDRSDLIKRLSNLAPADWSVFVAAIPRASQHLSRHASIPEQVGDLVRWSESSAGPGLVAIWKMARTIFLERPPQASSRVAGGLTLPTGSQVSTSPAVGQPAAESERSSAVSGHTLALSHEPQDHFPSRGVRTVFAAVGAFTTALVVVFLVVLMMSAFGIIKSKAVTLLDKLFVPLPIVLVALLFSPLVAPFFFVAAAFEGCGCVLAAIVLAISGAIVMSIVDHLFPNSVTLDVSSDFSRFLFRCLVGFLTALPSLCAGIVVYIRHADE
jgi:hypothetical protein